MSIYKTRKKGFKKKKKHLKEKKNEDFWYQQVLNFVKNILSPIRCLLQYKRYVLYNLFCILSILNKFLLVFWYVNHFIDMRKAIVVNCIFITIFLPVSNQLTQMLPNLSFFYRQSHRKVSIRLPFINIVSKLMSPKSSLVYRFIFSPVKFVPINIWLNNITT